MANEITASASLSYNNPLTVSGPVGKSKDGFQANSLAQLAPNGSTISIAITATAIPLGQITTPGWSWFRNLDSTNYVQLMNGATGAVFARLEPGEFALIPLDSACVPYAIANTAPIDLEFLISSR
jgi:hypothetical protein